MRLSVFLLLLAGYADGASSTPQSQPRRNTVKKQKAHAGITASGVRDPLRDQVTIYRDRFGVPHIVGDSEQATFFGYGYAQAEDHLEAMMLEYRDAQGRRSEVLGRQALGDQALRFIPYEYRWGGDYLQRALRTWQCVAENRQKIDPAVYPILDAFARGVNEFITEHRAQVPAWIDSVSAVDIEAHERSNYLRFYSVGDALSKLPGETGSAPNLGSNQWAIEPQKSENGRIIHVEHLHMPWAGRLQNYEAHLITPGKLDVAGISWFGSPFFLVGFNPQITWSVSFNQPNIADVYEEKLNPANLKQYLYDGHWRDIHSTATTFRVRNPNGGMNVVTLPLYYTHHGPIVRVDKDRRRAYSVKLPNFDGVNYAAGLYSLMKADSVDAFRTALARQLIPRWNFLCTSSRNVFWVHNAIVPRRDASFDWSKPVPGWLKATEWGPKLPFSSNPQLLNPVSGFVQNCNNPPWVSTRNSGLKPSEPAPFYLAHTGRPAGSLLQRLFTLVGAEPGEESLNARGERVFGILTQPQKKFTVAEMVAMGFDTYILAADIIIPLLNQAAAAAQPVRDVSLTRALQELNSWDRRSSAESFAFTYLYFWAEAYSDLYSRSDFDRFGSYRRGRIDIHSSIEQSKAWHAFEQSVSRIESKFGTPRVRWGSINVVVRGRMLPVGGNTLFDVLHPDGGPEQANGQIHCDNGWGHLMIAMEDNPKQVWSLLPYGESEHPDSPHYNDQAVLHSQRKLKPFWSTPREILDNTESAWGDPKRLTRLLVLPTPLR